MPEIRLQAYTAKIKDLIRKDLHDEALAHAQHILRHYPKHVEAYALLGEACLEKGMWREAIEFLQRTLSADPESFLARVGLGVIYAEQGALAEAIWQMERAFELAPGNTEVRRELQRLYAQRDGVEKSRLKLTRGALGRLYSRNGLYERAITEFQAVLHQDPDLPDVRVALAEVLWREERRLDAVEVCLDILDALPYCLKANLILGEIWMQGGHEDAGEEKLEIAQELDPENLVAQEVMGQESPLPPQEIYIDELEATAEEMALSILGEEETMPAGWDEEEERLDLVSEAPEEEWAEGEVPDWLQDIGAGATAAAAASRLEGGGDEEGVAEEADVDALPDWLHDLMGEEVPPIDEEAEPVPPSELQAIGELPDDEQVPDWLRELEGADAEGLVPVDALEMGDVEKEPGAGEFEAPGPEEPAVVEEEGQPGEAEEVPDWLRALHMEEPEAIEPPLPEMEAPGEEIPESLRALVEAGILDESDLDAALAEMAPEDIEAQREEEVPGWLQELMDEEAAPAPEVEAPAEAFGPAAPIVEEAPEEEVPDWLQALEAEEVMPPAAEEAVEVPAEPVAEEMEVEAPVEAFGPAAPIVEEAPDGVPEKEVPDWLQALEAEEVTPPAAEEAVEVPAEPAVEAPATPEVEEAAVEEVLEPVFEEEQPEIPEPVPVAAEVEALAAEEVAEEAEAEEPEPVLSKVEGLLVHLEDAPRDFGARLDLARAYRQNADWDAAIDQYERLIGARKFLHAVVDDLKALVEEDVRPARVYHLMGDALMHQDQLDEALEMYRKARKVLVQR